MRSKAALFACAAMGAWSVLGTPAWASEPAAAPVEGAPTYTLEIDSDAGDVVSFEAFAPRLSAELGGPVARASSATATRATVRVRYRAAERKLTVSAAHTGGPFLERTIDAVGDAEAVQREAVLLAGNLARDEARELLDSLAKRAKAAPAPPEPAPAPPAPPAPPASEVTPLPDPVNAPPERVIMSAALLYPLATNLGRPDVHTHFDLSLLYGRVGSVSGAQIGTALTYASRHVEGAQVTAAGGFVGGRMTGAQLTGGANVAREVHGVQLGPVNVADGVAGVQLGVVNVARKVAGVQLGVVNVAEEVDGAALGLVSITRDGIHPIAWASSMTYANVGVVFATKYVYTLVGATSGTPETDLGDRFGLVAGLGGEIPLPAKLCLDLEAMVSQTFLRGGENNVAVHQRAILGYSFAPHLRVFAGVGARTPVVVTVGDDASSPEVLGGVRF